MTIYVFRSGAHRAATGIHVNRGGWKAAQQVWVFRSGAWRLAWSGFRVTASPNPASGNGQIIEGDIRPAAATVSITATVTPGDGVSYQWSIVSSSGDNPVLAAATGQTVTLRYSSRFSGQISGVVRCTVTRAGATTSVDVPYTLTIYDP